MVILTGIAILMILCITILILTSFPVSEYQKKRFGKRTGMDAKDDYAFLFDVYRE
ncbi:hypothetical protein [Bacillus sp. REN3]|uniref:hypothetical protein n=1 Tax=Bacillus sp. REN3 TaxID=2802440 RepID=UPI001AEDE56D|nr:hypothetical protein [Bacillus sp. REN3]